MSSITNTETMIVNGMPVAIEGEKNILEIIRKAGFDMPTLCYYSKLSTYGACRMCIVEDNKGRIMTSCSTPPRAGMVVKTNTPKLRSYRKTILELMLANHNRDCTTCEIQMKCQLSALAKRFGVEEVRFDKYNKNKSIDDSSYSIVRHPDKCILCGDCVRVCGEIQNVAAIDFVDRGSKMKVQPAFNMPIAESKCVNCGQCASVCPTAAITVKNNLDELWEMLSDDNIRVGVQVAPAVRVGLGDMFNMPKGINVMGKIVAALRKLGFDDVYDTGTGADLTVIEEAGELVEKLESGDKLPLFTSCCPAWVKYAKEFHPELVDNISTCKSPMEMFGAVLKERAEKEPKDDREVKIVAIMPCTAKKYEIKQSEYDFKEGVPGVDLSITTQELALMIKETGLDFENLHPEAVDMPYAIASGGGIIFGVTGGVTEAVIRNVIDPNRTQLEEIAFTGVRGFDGVKEVKLPYGDRTLSIAVVNGLNHAEQLIKAMQAGEAQYDFVEVMACRGGCISGAGQPCGEDTPNEERAVGMYDADRMSNIRTSKKNPVVESIYENLLYGDNAHRLLHYK